MLKMYSDIRQTCKYGDVCNTCLTDDELEELVEILGCEKTVLMDDNKPGDCDHLTKQK